jgi:GNAT superfamily N-acetyltransferase
VSLRKATSSDTEFAYRALELTMREYAEGTWGDWSEAQYRQRTASDAIAGRSLVIERDGQPVGLLKLNRMKSHLEIDQLFILPAYQRQGIGGGLLAGVLSTARELGLPVRIRVLRVNPARALYERLGFCVTSEDTERIYMQREP